MISQKIINSQLIPEGYLYPKTIDDFLQNFNWNKNINATQGYTSEFEFESRMITGKFTPMISLASSKDARNIAEICRDAYESTYPYKEMMDVKAIKRMIKSKESNNWLF